MADFSNAIIEVRGAEMPMTKTNYLGADYSEFHDSNHNVLNYNTWNPNVIMQNTPTKVSILYSGKFTAGGTEFYIADSRTGGAWHVSNVYFAAGDDYSFVIDIEVTGST